VGAGLPFLAHVVQAALGVRDLPPSSANSFTVGTLLFQLGSRANEAQRGCASHAATAATAHAVRPLLLLLVLPVVLLPTLPLTPTPAPASASIVVPVVVCAKLHPAFRSSGTSIRASRQLPPLPEQYPV
jgi:hypothetical protein